ncbi:exopolysaccharide production repressor protein [Sinorhizobium sp. BG8]|uniref:exopolysaccharide production repressor protein n=1 Tax=Sinorhizobium sp. BG8 TaxID=2613773 RepID=UPI00193DD5D7|nr:exopolysaccharide production repressor protein [Sinorhizobium sp. BG8]QRM57351.1 exopolysaccharide production repressor exox [Sinorhizobium sp. BG8]
MYAPKVFFSMFGALVAFAVATYILNGSFWSTVGQTLICAVLLQVGYFVGVLFLVRKAARERDASSRTGGSTTASEDVQTAKVRISGLNKPGHFNQ